MEADGGAGSLRTARGPLSSSAKLLGHLGRGLRRGGGGGVGEEEAAAAAAAAEEEEGSRRREALLRPTLYVHDAMVPVGGETVLAWLDCMSLEFHLNVLMREESVRASGLHVEVVRIDASQPPPWFLALEDEDEDEDGARVGGTAGARRQRQRGGGKGAAAVAHTVPLLERGGTLHRGMEDISALLCAMFPQLPLSVEFGLNEPRACCRRRSPSCSRRACRRSGPRAGAAPPWRGKRGGAPTPPPRAPRRRAARWGAWQR